MNVFVVQSVLRVVVLLKISVDISADEDCTSLMRTGKITSGVYTISPRDNVGPINVYCDMEADGGGWTVFQRRQDGSVDFYRGWEDYKNGFGNLTGEFWLGNSNIHRLSVQNTYELRVDMEAENNEHAYALYKSFSIGSESEKYNLSLEAYSGDAGDSFFKHQGMSFSTKDMDNDRYVNGSCAINYKGAWWYKSCHDSNLNGLYLNGHQTSRANGINWKHYKGHYYSLLKTTMKIRTPVTSTTERTSSTTHVTTLDERSTRDTIFTTVTSQTSTTRSLTTSGTTTYNTSKTRPTSFKHTTIASLGNMKTTTNSAVKDTISPKTSTDNATGSTIENRFDYSTSTTSRTTTGPNAPTSTNYAFTTNNSLANSTTTTSLDISSTTVSKNTTIANLTTRSITSSATTPSNTSTDSSTTTTPSSPASTTTHTNSTTTREKTVATTTLNSTASSPSTTTLPPYDITQEPCTERIEPMTNNITHSEGLDVKTVYNGDKKITTIRCRGNSTTAVRLRVVYGCSKGGADAGFIWWDHFCIPRPRRRRPPRVFGPVVAKLQHAPAEAPAAPFIGGSQLIIVGFFIAFIIVLDLSTLGKHLKLMRANLTSVNMKKLSNRRCRKRRTAPCAKVSPTKEPENIPVIRRRPRAAWEDLPTVSSSRKCVTAVKKISLLNTIPRLKDHRCSIKKSVGLSLKKQHPSCSGVHLTKIRTVANVRGVRENFVKNLRERHNERNYEYLLPDGVSSGMGSSLVYHTG